MGYNVKFNDIRNLMNITIGQFSIWQEEINQILNNIQALVNLKSFQGQTAQSTKSYLDEVHNLLLSGIISTLQDYKNKMFLYLDGYYAIDSGKYTVIDEEVLEAVKIEYENNRSGLENEASRLERSLGEISDIFSIPVPKPYTLMDHFDQVQSRLVNLNDDIINYENNCMTDLTNLENLILALKNNINEYMISGVSKVSTYQSGDFATGQHIVDLATQMQISMDYNKINEVMIAKAIENEMWIREEMQKEYEEACEQRKDKGTANMIIGGFTVFAGTLAIIGTAGMATPIVITAVVTGTGSIAYGVSNITEGGLDYYYGSIGDLSTAAFNPIRDTVFFGNQTAYDMWGSINTTVSSLMIPAGSAIKGAKTMSTSVTKAVIRGTGKEILIDRSVDFTAGLVTNFVSDQLNLSRTQTVLLNMGLSIVGEKGVETGISHLPFTKKGVNSFGKLMDDADSLQNNDYSIKLDIEEVGECANIIDEVDAKAYNSLINDNLVDKPLATDFVEDVNVRNAITLEEMAFAEIKAKKIVTKIEGELLEKSSYLIEDDYVKVEAAVSSNEGGSNSYGSYNTKIDTKVTVINKQELPNSLVKTFKDGNYGTVITSQQLMT